MKDNKSEEEKHRNKVQILEKSPFKILKNNFDNRKDHIKINEREKEIYLKNGIHNNGIIWFTNNILIELITQSILNQYTIVVVK